MRGRLHADRWRMRRSARATKWRRRSIPTSTRRYRPGTARPRTTRSRRSGRRTWRAANASMKTEPVLSEVERTPPKHSKILILDFGSQYTQVIARRIRELQVYSEVVSFNLSAAEIKKLNPNGIVLSGGPASVYDKGSPQIDKEIFSLGIPVLGICYGLMQMAHHLGGKVVFTGRREYGAGMLNITNGSQLFDGLGSQLDVWNSHGDEVTALPKGFLAAGRTESSDFAAVEDRQRKLYGLQFHPEVAHTPRGKEILQNFVYHICHCAMDWTMGSFIEEACERVRRQVGDE